MRPKASWITGSRNWKQQRRNKGNIAKTCQLTPAGFLTIKFSQLVCGRISPIGKRR
jgi:hypothetical protein